jgi:PD-(D/E)XK endonuclease
MNSEGSWKREGACEHSSCRDGRIRPSSEAKRAARAASRTPEARARSCPALRLLSQTGARQPWCPPHPIAPLWRVQVKCSTQLTDGLYHLNAHRRTGGRAIPYLPGEIDFLAAYIIPEDTWYIIPLEAFLGSTSLLFRRKKDRKPGHYDQYKEAWHLLRPK